MYYSFLSFFSHASNRCKKLSSLGWMSVMFIILCSCSGGSKKNVDAPKSVNVAVCRDANELPPTSYAGLTRSTDMVNVAFRISGTLSSVLVKEGEYVRKGQVLAIMDDRDYRLQLNATQAEYSQIKADAERVMAMYEDGSTTAQNYDKARYGLEQITQKLQNHTNQLKDTRLVAPFSGYVKRKMRESGETVAAGMSVIILSTSDHVEIEISLPAAEFMHLDDYSSFYCTFNVTGNQQFPLKIVRKAAEANANQLYPVYLQFADQQTPKGVTSGMSAMVYGQRSVPRYRHKSDTGASKEHVIIIPATALVNTGDSTYVFVVDTKAGVACRRDVIVDFINPDGTVTISKGLSLGEKVVRTGAHTITDGQKVEIMEAPSKSNVGGLI